MEERRRDEAVPGDHRQVRRRGERRRRQPDGVAKAEAFVQALTRAGKNPTRASLMNSDPEHELPEQVLAPGCCQKTTKADHFVISQMQLQRLNANTKLFVPFGRPVARGARANSFSLRVTGTRAGKPALVRSRPVPLPVALHRRVPVRKVEQVVGSDVDSANDPFAAVTDVEHVHARGACSKWPRNMRSPVRAYERMARFTPPCSTARAVC